MFRILAMITACGVIISCGGGSSSETVSSDSPPSSSTPNPTTYELATAISDQRDIPIPNAGTYPSKGATVVDPVTNFRVTRVSDKTELTGDYGGTKSTLSTIVYSRFTPANTTGEFVIVHGDNSTSAWVYRTADNSLVTILRFKPSLGQASRSLGEVNELRWDYSGQNPNRLYFVGRSLPDSQSVQGERVGMSFYYVEFNPSTGVQSNPVLVRDFSRDFPTFSGGEIMNDVEGDSSTDSRYWAWMVMNTTLASGYKPYAVFSFDKTSNQIMGSLQRSCSGSSVPCQTINTPATAAPYITRPNMVEMSPLGTRVVVNFERAYAGRNDADLGGVSDGPKAYLPNFTDPIRIGSDATHSGWAWGLNGEELFVSQNNRNDWIEAVDIRNAATAKCAVISGNSYGCGTKVIHQSTLDGGTWSLGYHFGRVYDQTKRGWFYMNTYDTATGYWGKNQGLLVQIVDGSSTPAKVVRLGSTFNAYYDYRSEGSGALDFRAENVWTTGNWGFKDGRGDAIRIQLPSNWAQLLPK